jgi:hypothetical protein
MIHSSCLFTVTLNDLHAKRHFAFLKANRGAAPTQFLRVPLRCFCLSFGDFIESDYPTLYRRPPLARGGKEHIERWLSELYHQ